MPWTSEHTKWLVDTDQQLKTADGKDVEVWEFRHENDVAVLSAGAKHFRNHSAWTLKSIFYGASKRVKTILIHLNSLAVLTLPPKNIPLKNLVWHRSIRMEYGTMLFVKS
ncbi:hypothetical protein SDC9_05709 [bioreactor metagenome]|uniref:Uncharacterized protein n=1 Tax=bioreactor metagenome TaxID=1076179 RepID=A0A644SZU0_9ZZZZ